MSTKLRGVRVFFILALAAVLFGAALPARAAEIRTGDQVVIEAGQVIDDDLLVSADTVIIDGTVTGDLLAAGSKIIVNGSVGGSALLAAQDVQINGQVAGSVYGASYAGSLGENAAVGRNLFFGGYALETAAGSEIGRDAYVGGYQLVHNGAILRDLAIGLSALELNGAVGGDVTGQIDSGSNDFSPTVFIPNADLPEVDVVEPGMRVSDTAQVGGSVQVQETVAPAVVEEPVERGFLGLPEWLLNRVGEFIGLLIIGALVIYFLPRFLPAVGDELGRKPLPSFGWGLLLAFIVLPIAMIGGVALVILLTILFGVITFGELVGAVLTFTGGVLGFALVAYMTAAYVVAKLVVGYWAGRAILGRSGMNPASKWTQVAYLALGLLIFEALRAIPVAGFLIAALVMFFGLGAMLATWLDRRRGATAPEAKPVPAMA